MSFINTSGAALKKSDMLSLVKIHRTRSLLCITLINRSSWSPATYMTTSSKCIEGLLPSYLSDCKVQYKSVTTKNLSRVSPAAMLNDSYGNNLSIVGLLLLYM